MTFIPDGEGDPYIAWLCPPDVRAVAIGWLDDVHPYRVGPVDRDFLRVLEEAKQTPSMFTFGVHECELCLAKGLEPADESADLMFVAPDGTWYVAPTMIVHYITKHAYAPPAEFVTSVLSGRFVDFDEVMGLSREAAEGLGLFDPPA